MRWSLRALRYTASCTAAAMLLAMAVVQSSSSPRLTASDASGCSTTRTAVVFTGNSTVVSPTSSVVPCLRTTGYGGAETRVVVTTDGTLVYEPAIVTPGVAGTAYGAGLPGPHPSTQLSPGGLAMSSHAGSTWRFVKPADQMWVPQDDQLYADRSTGWLYYYALSPDPVPQSGTPLQDQLPAGYAQLMASPDDGVTWYHTSLPGYMESENPRFTSAPAPGQPAPIDYVANPRVVYWCGNDALFTWEVNQTTSPAGVQPAPSYRACYRSLDRGVSWSFASILFSTPVPQHNQCGTNGETFNADDGNYPQGAPDGSLYVLVACGSTTYLARSTDEGATWPIMVNIDGTPRTVPADGELRVDPNGYLYLVAQNGDALDLWTSTDRGATWQAPQDMTVPGSTNVIQWFMAEAGTGEVAVSYLAASGTGYAGFLSVTLDALHSGSTFYGTTLDDPGTPVYAGTPPPARDDFVGVDIGPDGTPWAAFYGSCSASDTDPGCTGQSGDPEANKAFIGHLQMGGLATGG